MQQKKNATKANRIAIRTSDKTLVAVIEIISPGNKSDKNAFDKFIGKAIAWIARGIHLLIIDPFPPTRGDPLSLPRAIWDNFDDRSKFKPTARKNRVLASYDAGIPKSAYVEPFGVGDILKDMTLFLLPGEYINVPLEQTYTESWKVFPKAVRREAE